MTPQPAPYLVTLPDGRLMDIRYRFKRGDRVLVVAGPHKGSRATVDSRDGQMKGEHDGICPHLQRDAWRESLGTGAVGLGAEGP